MYAITNVIKDGTYIALKIGGGTFGLGRIEISTVSLIGEVETIFALTVLTHASRTQNVTQ